MKVNQNCYLDGKHIVNTIFLDILRNDQAEMYSASANS